MFIKDRLTRPPNHTIMLTEDERDYVVNVLEFTLRRESGSPIWKRVGITAAVIRLCTPNCWDPTLIDVVLTEEERETAEWAIGRSDDRRPMLHFGVKAAFADYQPDWFELKRCAGVDLLDFMGDWATARYTKNRFKEMVNRGYATKGKVRHPYHDANDARMVAALEAGGWCKTRKSKGGGRIYLDWARHVWIQPWRRPIPQPPPPSEMADE